MKKYALAAAIAVIILLTAGLVWHVYSPGWAIDDFQKAAERRDPEKIAAAFDFPAFRENMKRTMSAQLALLLTEKEGTSVDQQAVQQFQQGFDRYVDSVFTPEGMTLLLAKKAKFGTEGIFAVSTSNIVRDSFSQFRVAVNDGQYLVFERSGLGWKLTGMRIPYAEMKKMFAGRESEAAVAADAIPANAPAVVLQGKEQWSAWTDGDGLPRAFYGPEGSDNGFAAGCDPDALGFTVMGAASDVGETATISIAGQYAETDKVYSDAEGPGSANVRFPLQSKLAEGILNGLTPLKISWSGGYVDELPNQQMLQKFVAECRRHAAAHLDE